MATRPPRITSTRRQPTRRVTRQPSLQRVLAPSWGRPVTPRRPAVSTPSAPVAPTATAAAQYSLSNLPPDASYEQAVALLQRQRQEGLAAIAGERTRTLSDYGFQEGPSGALTFDPNNPFSKAALLKKAYDTTRRSTGQSMASGGQLYSGAFQNAQDLVNRNQVQAEDAQLKAVQAFLAANTQRRAQAQTDYELQAGQAYSDRLGRFQENPLYDPAASGPGPAGAPAGASAATPAKPRRLRRPTSGLRLGRI